MANAEACVRPEMYYTASPRRRDRPDADERLARELAKTVRTGGTLTGNSNQKLARVVVVVDDDDDMVWIMLM